MNKTFKKAMSLILCIVLAAALALNFSACGKQEPETAAVTLTDGATLGKGAVSFPFTVVDPDGKEITVTVNTDKATVGEALLELGVVEGEDGEWGLYVTTVNGTALDYDKDGMYWAFYINGEYAMTGVDSTNVEAGTAYSFVAEKG